MKISPMFKRKLINWIYLCFKGIFVVFNDGHFWKTSFPLYDEWIRASCLRPKPGASSNFTINLYLYVTDNRNVALTE